MTDHRYEPLAVSRTISASAGRLFTILKRTANHPAFDGSGMVREPLPDVVLRGVGDVFSMGMYNDDMGEYEMRNRVVEYEEDRRLVWEPVLAATSRPDKVSEIGNSAHHRWGFELTPVGPDATVVTETFDCTRSPQWLKEATKGGETWVQAMTTSLQKLEALATNRERPSRRA